MKNLKLFILIICYLVTYNNIRADILVETNKEPATEVMTLTDNMSWKEIVEYASKYLPTEGKLIIRPDGYTYLKVDDDYIYKLFPKLGLEEYGYREPPFFRHKRSTGAHISVFYGHENVIPKEVGQYFPFELQQIKVVKPSPDISYVVLEVKSPELEQLRKKYGKKPLLHGHAFHISLGKKTQNRPNMLQKLESIFY